MTSTELSVREKTDQVIETLNHPALVEQIRESLPEGVPLDRFKRVAITAIRSEPKLVDTDRNSLFASIVRCAQDGLYPDGKESALVLFGQKVVYMPMIGGYRKIAGEHGWAIRTAVVYEHDEFEYELGLEPRLVHHPARPGVDRGERVYAYAIAVHRDGRKEFEVMTAPDVEKVRSTSRAKDSGPWKDWPERMWEKTAGRRLFSKLPLDPNDVRIQRVLAEAQLEPADAAATLYGEVARETFNGDTPAELPAAEEAATFVPPAETDEPEPQPTAKPDAGETVIPNGAYKGMTLAQVADIGDDGEKWLIWALSHPSKFDDAFHAQIVAFVAASLPELDARYQEWLGARSAA